MIEIRGLTKWYPTTQGRKYVLRDVTALIPDGVNVGIFGRNGAGKSTLLRIIGGTDHPNAGSVVSTGSISWPLGLAGGYQGSMTGRENARFVARIYGLDRATVARLVNFVFEFSELGASFDLPVKTYSTGMRARLSFAISMGFDFDCYLIDELTSVGDISFRDKSAAALKAKKSRANYIMVSHNIDALAKEVDIGIVVDGGSVVVYPDAQQALRAYKQVAA